MKFVQNALFRSWAARFAQIAFLRVKLLKIVTLFFPWNLYKTFFLSHAQHVLVNRIFEGQSSENRHTRLKFSSKRENSALFIKLYKTPYFQIMRSTFCPSRIFKGQTSENRYTCLKFSSKREDSALFMKIVQNALFRSCAARIGQIAFVSVNVLKIVSHTGLKFSSKRENSALSMKIVQNALFRSSAARFGQIALVSVKVVKIVTLASNSLQKGKTVRFSWNLYKTLFSGREQHVLAKSHFWASMFSKWSNWPEIVFNGKTVHFQWKLHKTLFSDHDWGSKFWKSSHSPEVLFKTRKQCAFHENCTKRSF